jgi:hypothetical protein
MMVQYRTKLGYPVPYWYTVAEENKVLKSLTDPKQLQEHVSEIGLLFPILVCLSFLPWLMVNQNQHTRIIPYSIV